MNGISDSLLIGVLLLLIFGAISFYLYSRLSQTEKRLSLMENLLLQLKLSTEASLMGPDTVEPVSGPSPLDKDDVDSVNEDEYAEMLKEIPSSVVVEVSDDKESVHDEEVELRPSTEEIQTQIRKMDVNYESMTVKELASLAKQKGLSVGSQRKKDLIDALKKAGVAPPEDVAPLASHDVEFGSEENLED
jgi:hypothetical protein